MVHTQRWPKPKDVIERTWALLDAIGRTRAVLKAFPSTVTSTSGFTWDFFVWLAWAGMLPPLIFTSMAMISVIMATKSLLDRGTRDHSVWSRQRETPFSGKSSANVNAAALGKVVHAVRKDHSDSGMRLPRPTLPSPKCQTAFGKWHGCSWLQTRHVHVIQKSN